MFVRAVLFDFGGTLDGPGSHWLPRFAGLYRDAGWDLPFARVRDAFDHATRCAYRDERVRDYSLRDTVAFHVAHHRERLGSFDAEVENRVIEGFLRQAHADLEASRLLLTRLRRRVALGVISNFYGNLERILNEAGITPLLTAILDSTRVGLSKPDPEIFLLAVERVGCAPAEALYVGDSFDKDIVGAHRAGLHTAWLVSEGEPPCPAPEAVDVRLRRLEDVEGVVE